MNHFDIRPLIEELPEVEFQALLSWIIGPERDRRKTVQAEAKARVEQVQALRSNGVLETPELDAEFKTGTVYLPSETAKVDDVTYEVAAAAPVSTSPTESEDWVEVVEPEPLPELSVDTGE